MKKRVIRLSESDLQRIVKRVIKENMNNELGGMNDRHSRFGDVKFSDLSRNEIMRMGSSEHSEDSDEDLTDDNEYYDFDGDIGELKRSRNGQLPKMSSMPSRHNTGEKPFRRGNRKM